MSNDSSNEPGNDTAAQAAFQVGDRVGFPLNTIAFSGTVQAVFERNPDGSGLLAVADGEENVYYVNARNLTLISRATPAPAPAQTDIRPGDLVEFAVFHSVLKGEVDAIHGDEAAVMVPAWDGYTDLIVPLAHLTMLQRPAPENPRIVHEPATPAPAATPSALGTLELPVLVNVACQACGGDGVAWRDDATTEPCLDCGGTGYQWAPRTIRPSDEAVDRLAAALAAVDMLAPVPYEPDEPDEPATRAPAPPVPFTALQRTLNAMDYSMRAITLGQRISHRHDEAMLEALEAIRQAVHALAESGE